jgi:prepilin-type N-terminal cleavage/methylation domain-containing protein
MRRSRKAFSLVEVVIAIAIIGVMLVGALSAVSASRTSQFRISRLRQAHLLAQALIAEIVQQDYEEAGGTFGPDSGETGGTRANFDDVDDYNGWSQSPPQDAAGTILSEFAAYRRRVTIEYLNPGNLLNTSAVDFGIKRITVSIDVNDNELVSLTAVRTIGRDALTP